MNRIILLLLALVFVGCSNEEISGDIGKLRIKKMEYQDNSSTTFKYDSNGLIVEVNDSEEGITSYQYSNGLVISSKSPQGYVTTYSHTGNLVTSEKDSFGSITNYKYNDLGKLVEIDNVFGTSHSTGKYEYNSKGNVSKIIFSDGGIETFYEYDDKPNFFSNCFYPKDLIKTTTDGNSSNNVTKWRDVGEEISSAEYTYNEKGYPITIIMNNEGVKEKVKITYESY
jgi:YD repeat-containing protein